MTAKEAGRGLSGQRRHALSQLAHDADGNEPGDERGAEGDGCAQRHRPAMHFLCADHARGNGSENQDAFKALTENEHADIEKRNRWTGVRSHRVRRPMSGDSLPDQNPDHGKNGERNEDLQNEAKVPASRTPGLDFGRGSSISWMNQRALVSLQW